MNEFLKRPSLILFFVLSCIFFNAWDSYSQTISTEPISEGGIPLRLCNESFAPQCNGRCPLAQECLPKPGSRSCYCGFGGTTPPPPPVISVPLPSYRTTSPKKL